jgi:hypothetical protein
MNNIQLEGYTMYLQDTWTKGTPSLTTTVPSKLITKLRTVGQNTSLCNWILNVLTGHPPGVKGR